MATPSASSAAKSAPFSRATPSMPPTPSVCAAAMSVTTPAVGSAMRHSSAISPGWFIPISTTARRCRGSRPKSTMGTPMRLLRLPCAPCTAPGKSRSASAATATRVVVLPAEPVMATTWRPAPDARQRRVWARARSPSAVSVERTRIDGEAGRRRDLALHDRGRGARGGGGREVGVPVVDLAAERDEAGAPR